MLGTMTLVGWKEIARYLRCGVRSAQRWQSRGLPVKRLYPGRHAPVWANSDEVDRWARGGSFWRDKQVGTRANVMRSQELRAQVERSREKLHHTLDELKKTWGSGKRPVS